MTSRRTLLKTALVASVAAMTSFGTASIATADELDVIKEKGAMCIAMSGAYPPFNFVNEENQVVGFDPSIGAEIARRMGWHHRWAAGQQIRRHRRVDVDHRRAQKSR